MRKHLFIFSFFLSVISYSQNWNVFNKNYRYNYKFDNSALISNVLFADSVKQTGTDTTYIMNNIGVVNGNILTINKPQFLMKKIIKQPNGDVKLQDTTNITIIPTCTLNQSWLFDSNYNLTATCVLTSTQTIFNITDSIKTIIVNNVDSVILSKQFGIIQFPKLYNQNKYYRLVGIEDGSQYDSIPLFGIKVPNAWDFNNFTIGKQFCRNFNEFHKPGTYYVYSCYKHIDIIKSKTVTPVGYIYNIDRAAITFTPNPWGNMCSYTMVPSSFTNMNVSYVGLNSKTLSENRMYPEMLSSYGSDMTHITKFGVGSNNIFCKFYGPSCASFSFTLPNQNEVNCYKNNGPPMSTTYTAVSSGYDIEAVTFGVSLGMINSNSGYFEGSSNYCTACYGTVDFQEYQIDFSNNLIYPNPTSTTLNFKLSGKSKIVIYNSLGALVKEEYIESKNTINVSGLPNGLYFIEIQTDSFKSSQKLIIQH